MIKKIIKRIFKIFIGLLLFTVAFIALMLIWPLPEISVPSYQEDFLLKDINIIDVQTGTLERNKDILISQGRIKSISNASTVNYPATIKQINSKGQYVIPGLWDMHSHSTQLSPWMHHPLLISHGVTGVREMSGNLGQADNYWVGASERLSWNKEISDNKRIAPRFIQQSSFQLDGEASIPNSFPAYYRLDQQEDVKPLLVSLKEQGVDFVKVYYQIPADSYRALAKSVDDYNIHLAGHKPVFVDLEEAIELGQRSFEHGRIFFLECDALYTDLHGPAWKRTFTENKRTLISACDQERTENLMKKMATYNAHWVPTLLTLKVSAYAHQSDFIDNPNLKYVMYLRKKLMWDFDIAYSAKKNIEQGDDNLNLGLYEKSQEHVRRAKEMGVPIMVGTDVTDTNNFAGLSVHYEMMDLVESGLTPLEAIQSATIIPAKYVNLAKEFGTVTNGKYADLLILDKNPLLKIENTQSINAVVLNGVYYDMSFINKLKSQVEKLARSIHMNIKFLYGMFSSPLMRKQLVD